MYGTARAVLRRKGLFDLADDAVQTAMMSVMKSPPSGEVRNWEAVLVDVTKKRALDILRSAPVRRSTELTEESVARAESPAKQDETERRLDRVAAARAVIARLSDRERHVVTQLFVLERDRADVAAELGVTPARVSQIATKISREIRAEAEGGSDRDG